MLSDARQVRHTANYDTRHSDAEAGSDSCLTCKGNRQFGLDVSSDDPDAIGSGSVATSRSSVRVVSDFRVTGK